MPVVSISNSQRKPLPWLKWVRTVHHGLPEDLYRLNERPDLYLAFLGRIAPEKRVDRAIKIAERAAIPLKIAAKMGRWTATHHRDDAVEHPPNLPQGRAARGRLAHAAAFVREPSYDARRSPPRAIQLTAHGEMKEKSPGSSWALQ